MSFVQIIVVGEEVWRGGVIENHAFPRADDVADEGFGTGDRINWLLAHRDFDPFAGCSCLGLESGTLISSW